jgi:hypothetical protein
MGHLSHDYDISLRWKVYHLFLSIAKGNGPDSYAGRLCARGKAVSAILVRSMTWHTGFSIRRMRIWLGQDFQAFWLFWDHLQDKRRTRRCSIWNSASRGDLHIVQMSYMTFSIYSQNQLDLRSYALVWHLLLADLICPCLFSVSSCVAVLLQERQELRELLGGPEGGGVVTCRDMSWHVVTCRDVDRNGSETSADVCGHVVGEALVNSAVRELQEAGWNLKAFPVEYKDV